MREKAEQGHWPTVAHIGYINDTSARRIEVDPERGPLVAKLFEWYATGTVSLQELTARAAAIGLTHPRSGRRLTKSAIHRVLHKPITRQGACHAFATRRTGRMCRPVFTSCVITFCSHLVMRGAAMRSVQELVGHQDLTMTQRCSHLSPAGLIDTVRLLESRVADSERGEILETEKGRERKLTS
jgi:integrase